MRNALALALLIAVTPAVAAAQRKAPSIDQTIELKRPGAVALSPDGTRVAFTVSETNWDENAYETEIFLARPGGGEPIQLTRAKKSSMSPAWSPDGKWLAFVSDRTDKRQLYVINPLAGEAIAITNLDDGVGAFRWSPDGRRIAMTMTEAQSEEAKAREKKYGAFEVVDTEYRMTHLYVMDVNPAAAPVAKPKQLTKGAYTVGGFSWSPDGRSIAFDHRQDPNLENSHTADISVVAVADGAVRRIVTTDGPDSGPVWSPDGTQIAFSSAMSNPSFFYTNNRIAIVPAAGGAPRSVSDAFDEQPGVIDWAPSGILFSGLERASSRLYRLDPASARITPLTPASGASIGAFSFSRDFSTMAFVSGDAKAFPELFVAPVATPASARKLTSYERQIRDWTVGSREMISWKSTDGAVIEGVLHKPADFQPGRKYPLLVNIHGGPTGISRPYRVAGAGPYPIEQFLAKGAIILEPNYRGSAGYGEKFRALNVRNLGVGDAWDVLSGVDHLVGQGLADPERMGVMGWSQGGYISAFLATHERQPFKAISVGAGISNWMTYYVNTDIHPFTRQYLGATPWDDPAIYALTSPMTNIKRAKTPTLIQHGEFDTRVPTPNAYELYQGLRDVGVPVKLIIYKGFGHGLNKPKAARAAMEHNLEWFGKYVFGESAQTPALQSFVKGEGRPVVMLGGGVHGAAGFVQHAEVLAPDFKVVRLQTLNIERAQKQEPLPAGHSVNLESAAMARALDALSLTGPVDLLGVSYGGLVALDFALDHPERVRTLTLFEPPAFWAMPDDVRAKSQGMRAMMSLTETFGPEITPTDAQLASFLCALGTCSLTPPAAGTPERTAWDARRASLRGLAAVPTHRDSSTRLATFRRPVLIMTGSETVNFHRSINETLASLLPMAQRVEVKGGHTAPTASRDDFLAKWRAFLAKH